MPLITDYAQAKEVMQEVAEKGVAMPAFCTEDRETLEAILAAVHEFGKSIGVDDLPIITSWTARYPGRSQITRLTACGDVTLGTKLMFSDLDGFMGETSPYRNVRVLPHLDHAFPWLDWDVLMGFTDKFASVMCDASEKPFEENIRLTADYVQRVKGKVMVEGAVDEVFEPSGAEKNQMTSPEQAKRFVDSTGVDLIVPNVGTEHRSTAARAVYRSDVAREICAAVGRIMCIHGTSSVKAEDLHKLPDDGFVKVNIYTTLAVYGGQGVARQVLDSLKHIFTVKQLEDMIEQGTVAQILGTADKECAVPEVGPKLDWVTNARRRDAWFVAVKERCKEYLTNLNYGRYAK